MAQNKTQSKIATLVRAFAEMVATVISVKAIESVVVALRNIATVLTETNTDNVVISDNTVTAAEFAAAADLLVSGITVDMDELDKAAVGIRAFVENELLEGDDLDIAVAALESYNSVKAAAVASAPKRNRTTRTNGTEPTYDLDFAIQAICPEHGVVVYEGERTNRTRWNSLRHYTQAHLADAHGGKFTDDEVTAVRGAKARFVEGADKVDIGRISFVAVKTDEPPTTPATENNSDESDTTDGQDNTDKSDDVEAPASA